MSGGAHPGAPERLFVDHRGGIRRCPPGQSPRTRAGIHGVLTCNARVLLVRPPGGNWLELPGGGIDPGEDPTRALQRELREEAGVRVAGVELAATAEIAMQTRYYAANHDEYWHYDQTFRLIPLSGEPTLHPPEEHGHEVLWLPLAELHGEALHHLHRAALDRLLGLCT
ncbi:hypothetical protein KBTX_01849 [wastewater metagenome]|uniref:Nudix hydrolase domain-containing protein n=2 Tax=unclassified sequences TaxID=12908 RepID=A0A5B8R9X8_9ZZZZ|nr:MULTISPECIES: NUDIX domain-containing protein [Arhodomonas]MCS4504504.1 NUDIX domain-containing protein [Arhodomonas aquaeolei]QEA05526.1 hypothetical protein KBTEX_01849 [uncultured organism]